MDDALLGLQWAGIAFGIFVMALAGGVLGAWLVRLIYGPQVEDGDTEDSDIGAPEGHLRIRREIDALDRERF